MSQPSIIAIFDLGKTNKKLFLFDKRYEVVEERTRPFPEIADEGGFPCDDIHAISNWVREELDQLVHDPKWKLAAFNCCAYGASFVHIDAGGKILAPLYNYLKPYPEALQHELYDAYEGQMTFARKTASPILGNLNSGLQLYYLKEEKAELFKKIHTSLHLPQYMSYLVSGRLCSDITSIGCHTALWNFTLNRYHEWLYKEGIAGKLAPIFPSDQLMNCNWEGKSLLCGAGLHDSSAALIPYLSGFKEPFVLVSTGTWCISLNPFNQSRLTAEELKDDCLCYMEYRGKPVKASRLFSGYEHEKQINRVEAIINSMTAHERSHHDVINGSRRKRIARGSGTTVQEVNHLLRQYSQMRKMFKQMGKGNMMRKLAGMRFS